MRGLLPGPSCGRQAPLDRPPSNPDTLRGPGGGASPPTCESQGPRLRPIAAPNKPSKFPIISGSCARVTHATFSLETGKQVRLP